MAIKVKELKDDVILDVKVNKTYYVMLKKTLFFLFNQISEDEKSEDVIKNIMGLDYNKMSEFERSFYTISLMISEIEKLTAQEGNFIEKEVLEPGDEGYEEPKLG
jgi:hypothetical protein